MFIAITSPAAFVAVIAGTALIFLRDVFTVWMVLKLVAVGALVALHVRQGYRAAAPVRAGPAYARWRQIAATVATRRRDRLDPVAGAGQAGISSCWAAAAGLAAASPAGFSPCSRP